jgi:nucleoside-diphosphate-sugar epimerase
LSSDEALLERILSQPTPAVVSALSTIDGDILVLGAGGKMGPSLARLATRSLREAGSRRRVTAVARFSNPELRSALAADGVETIRCDLADREQVAKLPDAPNIVYMVGQKFGTMGDEARTWGLNAWVPGAIAERFSRSRIVAFSTGNVYPLAPTDGNGPSESDPTGPIGEYAQSALARERILEFFSRRNGTPMAILRLNYAIEPRYGVLRDIADRVREGRPIDLGMGWVNVIWQRDGNAVALRALSVCASPPLVLNVTGRPALSVRWLAEQFGKRWELEPCFDGTEAPTALLSDASRMEALFGPPEVGIEEMIARVAEWVEQGGKSLHKPTHFESREGKF